MSVHLTERDRLVCELGAAHQQAVKEFEEAEASGTLTVEHFQRRRETRAALDNAAALPSTYKCSDGNCQDVSAINGHAFYTVIAWAKHVPESDQWVYREFDKSAVRHLIFCAECDETHALRDKLHERDLDAPIAKALALIAEVAILRADNQKLSSLLTETEQQVAQLRLQVSQLKKR